MNLTFEVLKAAVTGTGAALRCLTDYEPVGGPGSQIYPATYEGGRCAEEKRWIDGSEVNCVLIDSVQSQANRMEEALRDAWERGKISLPVISVDFSDPSLLKRFKVTSLDAPHRIADALLRDSLLDGKPFRKSKVGSLLDVADTRNATPLFEFCPTALVFGLWDSTGPRGGLGAKFQRAIVSEIVGLNAVRGTRTSSRIDPAQISKGAGELYWSADETGIEWTLDPSVAAADSKGKPRLYDRGKAKQDRAGSPGKANHGNVTPTISDGGYSMSKAVQTTVLSLPALRRLRFPLNGSSASSPAVDDAARPTLAALGICAAALTRAQGTDLRSRCQLHATAPVEWELLDTPGQEPVKYELSPSAALDLFRVALAEARAAGLPWCQDEVLLTPSRDLLALVRKSQQLTAIASGETVEA